MVPVPKKMPFYSCPGRGIVDDTVRSLILASSGGAEVKGMIPVGQWQKVGSLLVGLVDSVELPSLRDNACEDCQVGRIAAHPCRASSCWACIQDRWRSLSILDSLRASW